MLESDKIVLRYKVMSNAASKVSKVAEELATIYDAVTLININMS